MVSCASGERYSPINRFSSLGASGGSPAASAVLPRGVSAAALPVAIPTPADKTRIDKTVLARPSTVHLSLSLDDPRVIVTSTYRSTAIHATVEAWRPHTSKTVVRELVARLVSSQAHCRDNYRPRGGVRRHQAPPGSRTA